MNALKQQILALTTNETVQEMLSSDNYISLRKNKDFAAAVTELRKHLTAEQIENYDDECCGVLRFEEETHVDDIVENILLCCKYNDFDDVNDTLNIHFKFLFG